MNSDSFELLLLELISKINASCQNVYIIGQNITPDFKAKKGG